MTTRSVLGAVAWLAFGWFSVLGAVTLFTDAAPAFVVVFPSDQFLERMGEDTSIISATPITVTVASDQTGFAFSLYRKGAWLVLPAGLRGCS